jgi:hypothetical protein
LTQLSHKLYKALDHFTQPYTNKPFLHFSKIDVKFIFSFSLTEDFEINIEGIKTNIFNHSEYKKVFVNDYLIPIEAAKFVFFDAEKIASWAELSTKEEDDYSSV